MLFRFLRLALVLLLTVCFQAAGHGRGPEKKALTSAQTARIVLKIPAKAPVLKLSRHVGGGSRSQLETEPVFDRVLVLEDVEDDLPDTDDMPEACIWACRMLRPTMWVEGSPQAGACQKRVCGRARRMFRAARSDLGSEG